MHHRLFGHPTTHAFEHAGVRIYPMLQGLSSPNALLMVGNPKSLHPNHAVFWVACDVD